MFQSKSVRAAAGTLVGGTVGILLASWVFQRYWSGSTVLGEVQKLALLVDHIFWGVLYGMVVGASGALRPQPLWTTAGGAVFGVVGVLVCAPVGHALLGSGRETQWGVLLAIAGVFPVAGLVAGDIAARMRTNQLRGSQLK